MLSGEIHRVRMIYLIGECGDFAIVHIEKIFY